MKTKITIPAQHYVGMKSQYQSIPLAFITPNGSDKSSQSRIKTVNNWASGKDALDPCIVENIALSGFKMSGHVKRYGRYGSGDKWCIVDPRGFELEISSANLAYILQNCIVENGTILDLCIWGRQSGNNILLPCSTELYINAVTLTEISQTTESLKNVKKGNTILLKNGTKGQYLGKYHILTKPYNSNKIPTTHTTAQHMLEIAGKNTTLYMSSTIAISSIIDKTEITAELAEVRVNEILQKKNAVVDCYIPPLGAFANKPINWTINLTEVNNVYDALNKNSDKIVIVKLKNDIYGVVNFYRNVKTTYSCDVIDITQLANEEIRYKTRKVSSLNQFVGTWETDEIIIENFQDDDVDKVYHIEIYSKTKLGNVIKRNI